jgi:thiol:disulfide interchange protein
MRNILIFIAFSLLLAACDEEKETQASHTPTVVKPAPTIKRAAAVTQPTVKFTASIALDQAFAQASSSNKPIFVMFTTDYCTPCKMMEEYVFTVPDLANYLNSNFVNYKFDCMNFEAGDYTKKYGVKAYPTLAFLRPDGRVILMHVGSLNYTEMRQLAQTALTKYRGS